jgi:lysozyme
MGLIDRIMQEEGYSQFPYRCPTGKTTIGYGRNLDDKGVSPAEAEALFLNDILECETDLRAIFTHPPQSLTLSRWEALMDMRYNLGAKGFRRFERMIQAVKDGQWEVAAEECLDSLYAKQLPKRAGRNADLLRDG